MIDLDAITARRAALFDGGAAWQCSECDLCHACHRLTTCDAHDDDDVPALIAEVERLRSEQRDAVMLLVSKQGRIEAMEAQLQGFIAQADGYARRVSELEAENERLKAAGRCDLTHITSYRVDL